MVVDHDGGVGAARVLTAAFNWLKARTDEPSDVLQRKLLSRGSVSAVIAFRFSATSKGTIFAQELYAPGQMDESLRRASEKIRREEGLLLPEEIKRIREDLGLTQSDLEELLGLGAKTVVRWEKGTVFQNSATDSLLRALRDVAGVAEYFAQRKGVEIRRASRSA